MGALRTVLLFCCITLMTLCQVTFGESDSNSESQAAHNIKLGVLWKRSNKLEEAKVSLKTFVESLNDIMQTFEDPECTDLYLESHVLGDCLKNIENKREEMMKVVKQMRLMIEDVGKLDPQKAEDSESEIDAIFLKGNKDMEELNQLHIEMIKIRTYLQILFIEIQQRKIDALPETTSPKLQARKLNISKKLQKLTKDCKKAKKNFQPNNYELSTFLGEMFDIIKKLHSVSEDFKKTTLEKEKKQDAKYKEEGSSSKSQKKEKGKNKV